MEHEVLAPNGEIGWQQWIDRPIFDEQGCLLEYQAVGRDITARVRAELELQENHKRLALAQEAGRVAAFGWYPGRNVHGWSKELATLHGLEPGTLACDFETWLGRVHPEDRPGVGQAFERALETGELFVEYRVIWPDGSVRWLQSRGGASVSAAGAPEGVTGVSLDITDRRQSEEERHLLEAARAREEALRVADRRKDEFLAMLAHELRNPLAAIRTASEMMRRLSATDERMGWARDVIARQGEQLMRLVDDLLEVTRITRGEIELRPAIVDLVEIVGEGVEALRPTLAAQGLKLSVNLPPGATRVRGDAVRLAQVVSNLLNNAVKYTEPGGKVSLQVKRAASEVILSVEDNGIGIPGGMLDRIFDPFTQLEGSRDRSRGGLGIGLTLVKRIAEMHGGSVLAESGGLGQGSRFVVRLPALPRSTREPRAARRPARDRRPGPRRRILVVDDNIDAAETLREMLALENHEVTVVHDGLAAVDAAEQLKPDVVLLDLGLPRLDGLQVARRLRERWGTSHPLLVATTGFGQEDDRRKTAAAGFDHHMIKPIDLVALSALLDSYHL